MERSHINSLEEGIHSLELASEEIKYATNGITDEGLQKDARDILSLISTAIEKSEILFEEINAHQ